MQTSAIYIQDHKYVLVNFPYMCDSVAVKGKLLAYLEISSKVYSLHAANLLLRALYILIDECIVFRNKLESNKNVILIIHMNLH